MSYEPQLVLSDTLENMRQLTTAIKADGHMTEQSRLILYTFMSFIVNETHPAMFSDDEHDLLEKSDALLHMADEADDTWNETHG